MVLSIVGGLVDVVHVVVVDELHIDNWVAMSPVAAVEKVFNV